MGTPGSNARMGLHRASASRDRVVGRVDDITGNEGLVADCLFRAGLKGGAVVCLHCRHDARPCPRGASGLPLRRGIAAAD